MRNHMENSLMSGLSPDPHVYQLVITALHPGEDMHSMKALHGWLSAWVSMRAE